MLVTYIRAKKVEEHYIHMIHNTGKGMNWPCGFPGRSFQREALNNYAFIFELLTTLDFEAKNWKQSFCVELCTAMILGSPG